MNVKQASKIWQDRPLLIILKKIRWIQNFGYLVRIFSIVPHKSSMRLSFLIVLL
jgi:hypothetical protein